MSAARNDAKSMLDGFEIVDCAVRSAEYLYLLATHVYTLDDDADDGPMGLPTDEPREAIRIAVYFPDKPSGQRWAFRTLRHIEFMRCAVARVPVPQLISVSLDGQVYALGSGVSAMEARIAEHRHGPLRGSVRAVTSIDGQVYAVQGNRGLCRRAGPSQWHSLCADLPVARTWQARDRQGFNCVAGSSASHLYAGGDGGDLWRYDGQRWETCPLADRYDIVTLCCTSEQEIYAGCRTGEIFRGCGQRWDKVAELPSLGRQPRMTVYQGQLWCASGTGIWTLQGHRCTRASVPEEVAVAGAALSASGDLLLIAGAHQAAWYDGRHWRSMR